MLKKTQRGPGKVADITDLAKAQSKQIATAPHMDSMEGKPLSFRKGA